MSSWNCASGCCLGSLFRKKEATTSTEPPTELSGEITMWHSFTQGPRLESIQKSADAFMQKHPKTKSRLKHFLGMTSILNGLQV